MSAAVVTYEDIDRFPNLPATFETVMQKIPLIISIFGKKKTDMDDYGNYSNYTLFELKFSRYTILYVRYTDAGQFDAVSDIKILTQPLFCDRYYALDLMICYKEKQPEYSVKCEVDNPHLWVNVVDNLYEAAKKVRDRHLYNERVN